MVNNNDKILSLFDCAINVFQEKIPQNGEDSFLYIINGSQAIAGVFDGCGGSGAKKYEKYAGKTGAYMASRVVSGAARDWYLNCFENNEPFDAVTFKGKIKEYLGICREVGGSTTTIRGTLSKDFPTTAAVVVVFEEDQILKAKCLWAGDSRCYLLNGNGLKQLTEDDLDGVDAMENLSADGVLTNVITASKDFALHEKTIELTEPGIIFAATDGCFGYYSTPMEFEHLLLNALINTGTVDEMENTVVNQLQEISGDDFTLSGIVYGFNNQEEMKKTFENRFVFMKQTYMADISTMLKEQKIELWKSYQPEYSQYLIEK